MVLSLYRSASTTRCGVDNTDSFMKLSVIREPARVVMVLATAVLSLSLDWRESESIADQNLTIGAGTILFENGI